MSEPCGSLDCLLEFAARNGNLEMVKLLVERRADLSGQDAFFIRTAAEEAMASGDVEMVRYFTSKGAPPAEYILAFAIDKKDVPLLRAVAGRPDIPGFVIAATHAVAVRKGDTEVAMVLEGELNRRPDAIKSILSLSPDSLQRFTGRYRDDRTAQSIDFLRGCSCGSSTGTWF